MARKNGPEDLLDEILFGLEALADDSRAGKKRYREVLEQAALAYREENLDNDRNRVRNVKAPRLKGAGLTADQLGAKRELIQITLDEATDLRKEGRRTRRVWRRFLKGAGLVVDTFLDATTIGHALKELLDLADVVLDS